MLTYIYDIMFSCDMLMFVAMMSSYIPLYILLFKTTENNISVETMLVNKIRELEIENKDLRAKLVPLDDEKLSIKKPKDEGEYEGEDEDEGDDEGDDEGEDEGEDEEEKTNNLTDSLSEELNFRKL